MIRQNAVQNNMRNVCGHRGNEGTITGRAASTLQGVDVSCKTIGDAAGMSHGGNECPPNRCYADREGRTIESRQIAYFFCSRNTVRISEVSGKALTGFSERSLDKY